MDNTKLPYDVEAEPSLFTEKLGTFPARVPEPHVPRRAAGMDQPSKKQKKRKEVQFILGWFRPSWSCRSIVVG